MCYAKNILGTILDLLFATGRISYYGLRWTDGGKIDWTVGTNNGKYVGGVIEGDALIEISALRDLINSAISAEDPDYVPPYTISDLADFATDGEDLEESTDEDMEEYPDSERRIIFL